MRLELGCGTNPRLKGPDVYYLDRKPVEGLSNFVQHDLESCPLPFPDNSFDLILAVNVLEHVTRIDPLMDEIHRIIKANGVFWVVVPHYKNELKEGMGIDHFHLFSEKSFLRIEQEQGRWYVNVRVIRWRDYHRLISNPVRKVFWGLKRIYKLNRPAELEVKLRPNKSVESRSAYVKANWNYMDSPYFNKEWAEI